MPVPATPRRRVGGSNGLSAKLSQGNGLGAEAPSQNPPDPHQSAAPSIRRSRLTTRPDREPGLTGHSLRGVSSPHFRMATDPGTNEYRDRPWRSARHSLPAPQGWVAGVRMSVGCGSSTAYGPGVAPASDSHAGSPRDCLSTAATTPRPRSKRPHRSRAGEVLSLDSESLMRVRHCLPVET